MKPVLPSQGPGEAQDVATPADQSMAPPGQLSRRGFLQGSAALAAAPLLLAPSRSEAVVPPSPATIPWQEFLPDEPPLLYGSTLTPAPTELANTAAGEAGRPAHQRWAQFGPQAEHYELHVAQREGWVFNPAYPPQPVWTFQAPQPDLAVLSPVVHSHYGHPMICRIYNDLPANHTGFGTPEISTHLHNAHVGSESDGFPGDYYSATKAGPNLTAPGGFKDHLYSNIYAGYDELQNGIGDYREALGTLFYHDHTVDFTAPNVVRGLVGFFLLFDHIDSGNEKDPSPSALRLPSHPYDYPLAFGDRRFDPNGILYYDQVSPEGILGDKTIVNGKIEPVLRVARRKYRLRLLNGGPSRFYQFYLVRPNNVIQPFTYIANDGNLLEKPLLNQTNVRLAPAERGDIVVDFSRYPVGTELYLVNRLTHRPEDTRRPYQVVAPGVRVLKIVAAAEHRPTGGAAGAPLPVRAPAEHVGDQRPVHRRQHAARADPAGRHGDLGAVQHRRRLGSPHPYPLRRGKDPQQNHRRPQRGGAAARARAQGRLRDRRAFHGTGADAFPRLQGQVRDALPQPDPRRPRHDAALGHRLSQPEVCHEYAKKGTGRAGRRCLRLGRLALGQQPAAAGRAAGRGGRHALSQCPAADPRGPRGALLRRPGARQGGGDQHDVRPVHQQLPGHHRQPAPGAEDAR
jgi:FtsP/CotA-like multicopper oxidase with cupredoxin domain